MTDTDWRELVLTIAWQDRPDCKLDIQDKYLYVQLAKEYLWAGYHWERLRDTPHGNFIRECVSPVPDLGLRAMYREQVLNFKEAA